MWELLKISTTKQIPQYFVLFIHCYVNFVLVLNYLMEYSLNANLLLLIYRERPPNGPSVSWIYVESQNAVRVIIKPLYLYKSTLLTEKEYSLKTTRLFKSETTTQLGLYKGGDIYSDHSGIYGCTIIWVPDLLLWQSLFLFNKCSNKETQFSQKMLLIGEKLTCSEYSVLWCVKLAPQRHDDAHDTKGTDQRHVNNF